jgi:predicted lysophospholipase L1 biosynthesis ABC-type transport system permease subunit
MTRAAKALLVLWCASTVGCASVAAVGRARDSMERAKMMGAEVKAPYEYYAAEVYLDLAEHEKDELDLRRAKIYAEKSEAFALQAIEKAGGGVQ